MRIIDGGQKGEIREGEALAILRYVQDWEQEGGELTILSYLQDWRRLNLISNTLLGGKH